MVHGSQVCRHLTGSPFDNREARPVNKRIFDGIVLTTLLLHAALFVPRMAARRWTREETGALRTAGQVVQIGLGK